MKIKSTREPITGRRRTSRIASAAPLPGLVLIAGLLGAAAAGTASTGSASAAVAVSPSARTSIVAVSAATASRPPAGSYTALNPQNNEPVTFYVSSARTSLQDISIPVVQLNCVPGGADIPEPFGMAAVPLKSSGAFTATTTQTGAYAGHRATFTYTFRGNFHGAAPSGAARAAGTFRETITFTDSTARTCTSDTQSWTATRTG